MLKRWVLAGCVAACAIAAEARVIRGGVYEDRLGHALRGGFHPLQGVTVRLYRDNGDRAPSAGDALVTSVETRAESGLYSFDVNRPGDYWVVVDSKSIIEHAWPEQTFGPAGSLCARPSGATVSMPFEGACFGGRTTKSDDAAALATSEHVAAVTVREDVKDVDFAFSFDIVTSTADGERVQGSLRQYLTNANAIGGPNRMRFVPLTPAGEQRHAVMGVPSRWWVVTFGGPLPALRDEDTLIDGTAWNFLSPTTVANVHPGRIGDRSSIMAQDENVARMEKPELELVMTGSEGIVCESRCGIRGVALRGAPVTVALRADARLERVLIGASPDAEPVEGGVVGMNIEKGTTVARFVLVTSQSTAGIFVAPGARLDGEWLDVSYSGTPTSGAGIALYSNGSSVRLSTIAANAGVGIVIGNPNGQQPAHGNVIDGSTISTNQAGVLISGGSSRNAITRNDIMWNRYGGVTVAPFESGAPRENRLSANRFDENGMRPIVFDLAAEDPNALARGAESCERNREAVNGGISPPLITSAQFEPAGEGHRVTIRGRACPGEVVEVYQSFVTSAVKSEEQTEDIPLIRAQQMERGETITTVTREVALPSIGEFNYLGTTNTAPDGTFEGTFPFTIVRQADRKEKRRDESDVWATDVLHSSKPSDRAFSAIAIDAVGNTSEMSVRRQIDR